MQPFEVTKESPIPFSGMYEGKYKARYDEDGKFLKLVRLPPIRELQDGLEVYERALNRLDSKDEFAKTNSSFKVYNLRHAAMPFYSVAQGACIRALADTQKK